MKPLKKQTHALTNAENPNNANTMGNRPKDVSVIDTDQLNRFKHLGLGLYQKLRHLVDVPLISQKKGLQGLGRAEKQPLDPITVAEKKALMAVFRAIKSVDTDEEAIARVFNENLAFKYGEAQAFDYGDLLALSEPDSTARIPAVLLSNLIDVLTLYNINPCAFVAPEIVFVFWWRYRNELYAPEEALTLFLKVFALEERVNAEQADSTGFERLQAIATHACNRHLREARVSFDDRPVAQT